MNGHPTEPELFDFTEGRLNPVRALDIRRHLETCAACQARQARHMETAHRLSDVLARAAEAAPFSPGRSWARLAPRLQNARRVERVAHALRLATSALAALLLIAGAIGFAAFLRPQPAAEPAATPQPTLQPAVKPAAPTPGSPTPRPVGRITLLVAGVDLRPGETGAGLTDSLMVLSLDRTRRTALVFSIPRDLWVDIPGHGSGRINTVYALGEPDGAALLKQAAGAALGIQIDHVVCVKFDAVVALIDAVGGVDVDVPADIDDPLYPDSQYGYDPLFIPAGRQHMDGSLALKYARTRHGGSDFERAARQQQVLMAVREKLKQLETWSDVFKRAPDLFASLKDAIATDLSLADMIDLAQQAREVADGSLRTAVLDGRYVVDYVTPEGAQVLLPLKDRISTLVNDMFETGLAPATPEAEMARVAVLNGTLQAGLAARTAGRLRGQGFNVISADNAERFDYAQTLIVDHAGRPATVKALAELLNIAPGSLVYRPDPAAPAEVEVILGADYAPPEP